MWSVSREQECTSSLETTQKYIKTCIAVIPYPGALARAQHRWLRHKRVVFKDFGYQVSGIEENESPTSLSISNSYTSCHSHTLSIIHSLSQVCCHTECHDGEHTQHLMSFMNYSRKKNLLASTRAQ